MTQLIGPYEVMDKLGSGGMGTVYRARHSQTGAIVALKVMKLDLAEDASYLRRFQREADIAGSVQSPNIVAVLDTGQHEQQPYIAMELVEGETLGALMRKSGPFPPDQALDIAIQVAQGLYAAYQKDVIHRDISPQNILVTPEGVAKIADFGIARSQSSGTLTGTGMFIGKPSYAAPEMFDGQADTRSDMYSLGIVLFEMLSGRPPFVAPTPLATMDMQMRQVAPRLADLGVRVPLALEQILKTCLQKKPAERFQTPRELLGALTAALQGAEDVTQFIPVPTGGGGSSKDPPKPVATGGRSAMPIMLGVSGVAIVGALGILAVVLAGGGGGDDAQTSPGASEQVRATSPGVASDTPDTVTAPITPSPPPARAPGLPVLLNLPNNNALSQPALGSCGPADTVWTFSWQPPSGSVPVAVYEVVVQAPTGATFFQTNTDTTSVSKQIKCNELVADDGQLNGWLWKVRGKSADGTLGEWAQSNFTVTSRRVCGPACRVQIVNTVASKCVNVRSDPTTLPDANGQPTKANVRGCVPEGNTVRISGGPRYSEGYIWWLVELDQRPSGWNAPENGGWCAEGELSGSASWLKVTGE